MWIITPAVPGAHTGSCCLSGKPRLPLNLSICIIRSINTHACPRKNLESASALCLLRWVQKTSSIKFLSLQQHWHYYWLFSNHEATFPVLTHFFCVPLKQKELHLIASGSPTVLLQQIQSHFTAAIMNFNFIIRRVTTRWRCSRIRAAAAAIHYHQHIQNCIQLQLKWRLTKMATASFYAFLRYQQILNMRERER